MVYKESSYFFIKPCGGQLLSRLAPGISVSFAITFQPVQYEDYTHRVTFYTDLDQYVLPIIGNLDYIVVFGTIFLAYQFVYFEICLNIRQK